MNHLCRSSLEKTRTTWLRQSEDQREKFDRGETNFDGRETARLHR